MLHTRNKQYAKSTVLKKYKKQSRHLDLEHLNKLLESFINKKAFKEMCPSSTLAEDNKITAWHKSAVITLVFNQLAFQLCNIQ